MLSKRIKQQREKLSANASRPVLDRLFDVCSEPEHPVLPRLPFELPTEEVIKAN